ncbi:MAG TPA: hypothetical protein VGK13_03460 [Methanocellaceae archaeon]|jgi:hypothetical protein
MISKNSEQLAVGEIVGYSSRLNFFSATINVLVKVDGEVIKVPIDYRQKKFIQCESPEGSKVAIGFFEGQWHIGSKPAASERYLRDMDVQVMELLEKANGPFYAGECATASTAASEAEEVSQLDPVFIKNVEMEFKGEASVILRRMGLAHLMVIT